MPYDILVLSAPGVPPPYEITLCNPGPINCQVVATNIQGGSLPYLISPVPAQYQDQDFLLKITSIPASAACEPFIVVIPPQTIQSCYPIYVSDDLSSIWYFNTNTLTTGFYFTPITLGVIICRDNNYIWVATPTSIDEYSTSTSTPTYIRSIDITNININVQGMCVWTQPNKLIVCDANSPLINEVIIIDISTNTATIDSTLFTLRPNRMFVSSSLYRDVTNGIIYLMAQDYGIGGNEQIEVYYDSGVVYALSSVPEISYGTVLINNSLYGLEGGTLLFNELIVSSGVISLTPTSFGISNILPFSLAQSPYCNEPQYVSTNVELRNALIEDFGGTSCNSCPNAHLAANQLISTFVGRVYAVNIHYGPFAIPTFTYPLDFRTTSGDDIGNLPIMGLAGSPYPVGAVNRELYPGSATELVMSFGNWQSAIINQINQIAYANIAGVASLNVTTNELIVDIEVYYTSNSPSTTNKYTVMLLQNNIDGPQSGANNNPAQLNPDGSYRHTKVLRDVLTTNSLGDDIYMTTLGSLNNRRITYTVPATYGNTSVVLSDLTIIAFISESDIDIINVCEIPITLI